MSNIFVISDTHFGRENIYKFETEAGIRVRPEFTSAAEGDAEMIRRWNATIRPQDHVYHLGDVAMRKEHLTLVQHLAGKKRLIPGNHDIFEVKDYLAAGFQKICGYRVLDGWIMSHIPIHPDSLGRFRGNVHGHIHERPSSAGRYINVSVEAIAYTPIPLASLAARLLP